MGVEMHEDWGDGGGGGGGTDGYIPYCIGSKKGQLYSYSDARGGVCGMKREGTIHIMCNIVERVYRSNHATTQERVASSQLMPP